MPRHQSADELLPDLRGQRRPHPRPPCASPAAAFGLVTFLMHENVDRNRIRKHLLTFAFAAPVMALSTFLLLVANNGDTDKVSTRLVWV